MSPILIASLNISCKPRCGVTNTRCEHDIICHSFSKRKKEKESWDSRLILLQLMSVTKWSFIQISIIRDNTKYTNTLMSPISVGYRLELHLAI